MKKYQHYIDAKKKQRQLLRPLNNMEKRIQVKNVWKIFDFSGMF